MAFDRSSRKRLSRHTARLFTGDKLFDRIARTVCEAECLPRKELFEAWFVARRVRRYMRGGPVIELCAGHGLLSYMLLLIDDSSPDAHCFDPRKPLSAGRLSIALEARWPRLAGRVHYHAAPLEDATITSDAAVVSVHACGKLTDRVLDAAIDARARVAVMPCCHDLDRSDDGSLRGWLPGAMAVDVVRAQRLRTAGYRVRTRTIDADITPQNRILLGEPLAE
jgi:hypothetical protein